MELDDSTEIVSLHMIKALGHIWKDFSVLSMSLQAQHETWKRTVKNIDKKYR